MGDILVCPLCPNCTVQVKRGSDAAFRVREAGRPDGRRPIAPSKDLSTDLHELAKYVVSSMNHTQRGDWYWMMGQQAPEKRRLMVSVARAILQEPPEVNPE